MNSARIDSQLRKLGYFLVRRRDIDGAYWFVGSAHSGHSGWNCGDLAEAKSLLAALREEADNGGIIIHDGSDWVCVAADEVC